MKLNDFDSDEQYNKNFERLINKQLLKDFYKMNTNNKLNLGDYSKMAKANGFVARETSSTVIYNDIWANMDEGIEPNLKEFQGEMKRVVFEAIDDTGKGTIIYVRETGKSFGLVYQNPALKVYTDIPLGIDDNFTLENLDMFGILTTKAQLVEKHTASVYAQIEAKNSYKPDYPVIGSSGANGNDIRVNGFDLVLLAVLKGKGKGRKEVEKPAKEITYRLSMFSEVFDELMNDPKYIGRISEVVRKIKEN